jgi:hypothetical protein
MERIQVRQNDRQPAIGAEGHVQHNDGAANGKQQLAGSRCGPFNPGNQPIRADDSKPGHEWCRRRGVKLRSEEQTRRNESKARGHEEKLIALMRCVSC